MGAKLYRFTDEQRKLIASLYVFCSTHPDMVTKSDSSRVTFIHNYKPALYDNEIRSILNRVRTMYIKYIKQLTDFLEWKRNTQ